MSAPFVSPENSQLAFIWLVTQHTTGQCLGDGGEKNLVLWASPKAKISLRRRHWLESGIMLQNPTKDISVLKKPPQTLHPRSKTICLRKGGGGGGRRNQCRLLEWKYPSISSEIVLSKQKNQSLIIRKKKKKQTTKKNNIKGVMVEGNTEN